MRYLAIGHVCEDVTPAGKILGGSVAYATLTARALGWESAIVTRAKPTLDLRALVGVDILHVSDEHTTTFENRYSPDGRIQFLHEVAGAIRSSDIPATCRRADIVHLAPIAREVDLDIMSAFAGTFIGITPQGWMRQWDEQGRVGKTQWEGAEDMLRNADAVILSIEDVQGDWDTLKRWMRLVPTLVATEGERGATVFNDGAAVQVPAPRVTTVDPTGAGDIFATAFFTQLRKSNDPVRAAEFANRIASRSITRVGIHGVPTLEEVRIAEAKEYKV